MQWGRLVASRGVATQRLSAITALAKVSPTVAETSTASRAGLAGCGKIGDLPPMNADKRRYDQAKLMIFHRR